MARGNGKRCARAGCRAWALHGGETCRAHTPREPGDGSGDGSEEGESTLEWLAARRRTGDGKRADLLGTEVARLIAEAGREGSLAEEIGALRSVMARLLDDKGVKPQQLAESIPRIVGATVRALKVQRTISGETAGDLTEALTRVLLEMGLGE